MYRLTLAAISILLFLLFVGCSNNQTGLTDEKNKETGKNNRLISFSGETLYDMNDIFQLPDTVFKNAMDRENFHEAQDTILYKKDTLYVSFMIYVNSCGTYDGDIAFRSDTLRLHIGNIGEISCMSGRIDRFRFTIYNPENKQYVLTRTYYNLSPPHF